MRKTIFTEPLWGWGSTVMSHVTKFKCSTQRLRETEKGLRDGSAVKGEAQEGICKKRRASGYLLSADGTE